MTVNKKTKKLDSFYFGGDIFFTRSLIPRISLQEEKLELLNQGADKSKVVFDLEKTNEKNKKNKSNLFSRGRKTDSFFTEDSKLYITPKEYKLIQNGIKLNRDGNAWDGASARIVEKYRVYRKNDKDVLYRALINRYDRMRDDISEKSRVVFGSLTPQRVWNMSIIGAILFGMFSMTLIYRYLGEGASADKLVSNKDQTTEMQIKENSAVLGSEDSKDEGTKYIEDLIQKGEDEKREQLQSEIQKMVKGYPIEKMVPDIAKKDRIVAAFLVGIAMKESEWGKHVPVYKGQDCYNYWGYRGKNPVGTGGHSCFASPQDAVETVAKRIKFLVENKNLDTPAKMSIWKCGSACHKDKQVGKWISDVNLYFKKLEK